MRPALVALAALAVAVAAVVALHSRESEGAHRGGARPHVVPPPPSPADWPTYGFDAARSHAVPYRLEPPFRVAWRETGDWSLIEFPPVLADGRLFVGTNHGLLLALDTTTGGRLWTRSLGRCIASSPAVAGETVVVGVMAAPARCDRDVPAFVAAFDARTGRTLWRHRSGPVEASPLVVGGAALIGSWDGRLEALDTTRGHVRWTLATGAAIKAGAALAGSTAVVGSYDGSLYAVDAQTGRLRWSTRVGAPFYATATVAGGRIFDATVDGVMHAFEARTGAVLWSRRIGRYGYSAAAVAAGRVYVGSYDHRLYALDAATGAVLWAHEAPGPVSGAPTVLGRLVFFSSCGSCSRFESNPRARRTFAVDAETGALIWSFADGEYSPVVSDGRRIYLTGYTSVYALVPR